MCRAVFCEGWVQYQAAAAVRPRHTYEVSSYELPAMDILPGSHEGARHVMYTM